MGSREPHKKYSQKKTSRQAPKSCLILSSNPIYQQNGNYSIYLFYVKKIYKLFLKKKI